MEWDANQALTDTPESYVVSKTHGGTHLGAQELIYVENDSLGRASYGFSASSRIFDDEGDTHYSGALTIVERNDWSINTNNSGSSAKETRGWEWACGYGHNLNIRAYYSPYVEKYGAICTSDGTRPQYNSSLGSIAIKSDSSSYLINGYGIHVIPSNAAMYSNGGGHTVVPLDDQTSLALVVAPRLIEDPDYQSFLTNIMGFTGLEENVNYEEECADVYAVSNCFFAYLEEGVWEGFDQYPMIDFQNLASGSALDETSLTRIGIAEVAASNGSISGSSFNWLVEDMDCQLSDPQLVDLENGRYLFGYAKFQCVSDGLGYDRADSTNTSRMMIPKAYYVMEIDANGNILSGPEVLTDLGWGGLDEPVFMGDGKVAWTYISDPTLDSYTTGQQSTWKAIVYHSDSAK